jgi:hypothetical protein
LHVRTEILEVCLGDVGLLVARALIVRRSLVARRLEFVECCRGPATEDPVFVDRLESAAKAIRVDLSLKIGDLVATISKLWLNARVGGGRRGA